MAIGKLLLEKSDRGMMRFVSERLEVTPQTLRNWRRVARMSEAPKVGRPRYEAALKVKAKEEIRAELERQAYPGWRPIAKRLPHLPVRLVQSEVALAKGERRKRKAKERSETRESVNVRAREAIWTIDGAQIGKVENKTVDAQLIKDRGSLSPRIMRTGPCPKAKDIIELLEESGELPLVLGSDNGSPYIARETAEWLKKHKIIHLRSLPRTPQHNGAIEIAVREVKEAMQITGAEKLSSPSEASEDLYGALLRIRNNRPRASKGYKTSAVLDEELPRAYHIVDRNIFYEKCSKRLSELAQGTMKWRARRMREREVIYETLEEYGLITRTRGERVSGA